jgi:uncharacterized coiled-coil protein SlyX
MSPKKQITRATPSLSLVALVLACFAFSPQMRAALPPEIPGNPDGCYPAFTTAEGCNALALLGAGIGNTGVGWYSLFLAGDASFNTGLGAGALALTTTGGNSNTAVGAAAMLLNTTGDFNTAVGTNALVFNDSGQQNNAVGDFALYNNIDGFSNNAFGVAALFENIHASHNTAIGFAALQNNDVTGNGFGNDNTAVGYQALFSNTDGDSNTAVGHAALSSNTTGSNNTANGFSALDNNINGVNNAAIGHRALFSNTTGTANTATGVEALFHNTVGDTNTAIGFGALFNTTGSNNIGLGFDAGDNLTTGDNNIDIGNVGVAGESNTIRLGRLVHTATFIGGIRGVTTGINNAVPVVIDSAGQLGTMSSSRRFKHAITPIERASEAIHALKPVTFYYKSDATSTPQFGLIAEEVAEVNPDLVVRDENGEIYTVRYDAVNAMLLNEFLKEHRKNEEQEATIMQLKSTDAKQEAIIARQQKQIEALTAGLKKVSAQLELSKAVPQTVVNNR